MGEVAELLRRAKGKVTDQGAWCTEWLARDERDGPTHHLAEDARKFCAIGGLYRALGVEEPESDPLGESLLHKAGDVLITTAGLWSEFEDSAMSAAAFVNDHLGHAAVMQMYDQAIAEAERLGV